MLGVSFSSCLSQRLYIFALLCCLSVICQAQSHIPQVPRELTFADLTLRLSPQAQREIQQDVDALHRSATHFQIKLERARLYLPIVEREFKALGVPTDLKYLVIQESGLIPDAVSTSNAVGFWQFKQGTAEEVFLKVNRQIDERKNIVSSSQGAARYLKKNNESFDNWMCALVAYQMGLGGAKAYFGEKLNTKKTIEIDRNTYWYFKKYLAHKVAFEDRLEAVLTSNHANQLMEVPVIGPTTLASLAEKFQLSETHLRDMNKWTLDGSIPSDKSYVVVFVSDREINPVLAKKSGDPLSTDLPVRDPKNLFKVADAYPVIEERGRKANQLSVNGRNGVLAGNRQSTAQFASKIGIKEKKLIRFNDLNPEDVIQPGAYYYTQKKKTKATTEFHIVRSGETLWEISQKYGIKLSTLKAKNRIRKDSKLKEGMVLNLQSHRKRGTPIPMVPVEGLKRSAPRPSQATPDPTPTPTQPDQITHVVSAGETLYGISRKYGVRVGQIRTWNQLGSSDLIQVGQKLIIFKD